MASMGFPDRSASTAGSVMATGPPEPVAGSAPAPVSVKREWMGRGRRRGWGRGGIDRGDRGDRLVRLRLDRVHRGDWGDRLARGNRWDRGHRRARGNRGDWPRGDGSNRYAGGDRLARRDRRDRPRVDRGNRCTRCHRLVRGDRCRFEGLRGRRCGSRLTRSWYDQRRHLGGGGRYLVQQILERVVRRFPVLGRRDPFSGFRHQAGIGAVRGAHQCLDSSLARVGVHVAVVLQGDYFPLRPVHVVADIRLCLGYQPANMAVPGDHRYQVVLQRAHLGEVCPQCTAGGIGRTTGPHTAVEDLDLLVAAGIHHIGELMQDPVVLLRPVVEGVLIGFRPPARLEHLPGVLSCRPRNAHRLLSSQQPPGRSDETCRVGTRGGSFDRRARCTAAAPALMRRRLVSGNGRHG
ncbi:hypothetical protein I546_4879 [Mycobacterium kansasii 732]|nr:hypothetical protein I546_4879 [Mycobacterium kansasii 732]